MHPALIGCPISGKTCRSCTVQMTMPSRAHRDKALTVGRESQGHAPNPLRLPVEPAEYGARNPTVAPTGRLPATASDLPSGDTASAHHLQAIGAHNRFGILLTRQRIAEANVWRVVRHQQERAIRS